MRSDMPCDVNGTRREPLPWWLGRKWNDEIKRQVLPATESVRATGCLKRRGKGNERQ